ncbi:hypothetical protein [Nocardia nova]|uniref:Uncharacterized protein n=1 Tax=Nocardia nova SH22a TaxID=1415166 RepID=W5TKG1_9NOCA|nr:hypothetical protein [Nocardia nova]AHH19418.1 hypothetical protein NONO_c46340 [Nocardia nova SH22a]
MTWSTDPEENTAVEGMRALVGTMTALLGDVADARYADPAGGFTVT